MKRNKAALCSVGLLAAILAYANCGSEPGESEVISARDGGMVQVTNNKSPIYRSKGVFPGGAFNSDTRVTVSAGNSFVADPYLPQGPAVQFTPVDAAISAKATYTIPYALSGQSALLNSGDLIIFLKEQPAIFFSGSDITGVDTNNQTVTFTAQYLGTFQAGLLKPVSIAKGEARDFSFNGSGTHGYQLLQVDPGAELVLALSPLPGSILTTPAASTSNFTVTTSEASAALPKVLSRQAPGQEELRDLERLERHYRGQQQVRDLEKKYFSRQPLAAQARRARSPLAYKLFPTPPALNDKVNVKMLDVGNATGGFDGNPATGYITVAATVKATDPIILVDDETIADPTYGPQVAAAVAEVVQVFSGMILPRDQRMFGNPSDVDNNGKIAMLLTSKLNDKTNGILGFYTFIDVLTNGGPGSSTEASNECDLIFSVFPSSTVSKPLVHSTLAHELQHLINFNEKNLSKVVSGAGQTATWAAIDNNTVAEESWFNEGFSHFAEDVTGFSDITSGPFQIVSASSCSTSSPGLFCNAQALNTASLVDDSGYVATKVRAINYLFIRYLFEQAGGATLAGENWSDAGGITALQGMIRSNAAGMGEVANLFSTYDRNGPRNYRQLWGDFLLALWNDGYHYSVSASARWNYQPVTLDVRNGASPVPSTLVGNSHFGIDLSSTRNLVDRPLTSITLNFPPANAFPIGGNAVTGLVKTAAPYYLRFKRSGSNNELKITVTAVEPAYFVGKILRIN